MSYSPKHNYRAKDHLERGDPNKIVRGYELSEEFEAISREVADISYQLGDLQVNIGDGMNLDDLNDVSAALPDRDNLIIWNGTQWVSDSFSFIETALTFQGGYDLTSSAPDNPQDGDLYINDTDGAVDASWGAIGGTPVNTGNVVGYAESKGRWYLLGDLASTAVTSVGEGLGISVEDSKPREPVVGINRDDVDEWYADKEATENRFVDIETNITEIGGDITDHNHDSDYQEKGNYVIKGGAGSLTIVVGSTGTDPNTLYFVV